MLQILSHHDTQKGVPDKPGGANSAFMAPTSVVLEDSVSIFALCSKTVVYRAPRTCHATRCSVADFIVSAQRTRD